MSQPKILVIQTAFLGDLLLSIPLLKNIKRIYPEAELHLLCRQGLGKLMQDLKVVDHFYEVKKGSSASYKEILQGLHVFEFEKIYCPHPSLRSALLTWKLHAGEKIGFKSWWNFFYFHRRVRKDMRYPEAIRLLSLLNGEMETFIPEEYASTNGIQILQPVTEVASMDICANLVERDTQAHLKNILDRFPGLSFFDSFLDSKVQGVQTGFHGERIKTVAIFPGSVWGTKRWSQKNYTMLAQKFLQQGWQVILLGSQDEQELSAQIHKDCSSDQIFNLSGRLSWMETIAVLMLVHLVISNDSGGQHLAALVSAPTVGIFGPTILEFGFRPWNSNAIVVETHKQLTCRPCGKHGPQVCPVGTHECMESINVETVWKAGQILLSR